MHVLNFKNNKNNLKYNIVNGIERQTKSQPFRENTALNTM